MGVTSLLKLFSMICNTGCFGQTFTIIYFLQQVLARLLARLTK